jgi:RimJ/RimL family protein N-acetyltransferase
MDNSHGRRLLRAVKESAVADGAALCLTVGRPVEALLRPVATRAGSVNAQDVRVLTEWRNRFVQAFLTEFQANEARTARWLTNMVATDDTRILFMVDDARNGETIGYMGLAFIDWENSSGEADAIVRGREAAPGLMKRAMRTMLDWAHSQLGLEMLGVRVRSDNPAVEFYRKFGFRELRRVTLRRVDRADMIEWVEDESLPLGEPSLVHMTLEDTGDHRAR